MAQEPPLSTPERGLRHAGLARQRWAGPVAALLVMAIVALMLVFANRNSGMTIHVAVESRAPGGVVAVYYDDGGGFREEASVKRELRPGLHRYELPLPAREVRGIRVDPGTHDQVSFVGEVEARSSGRVLKRFGPAALVPGGDVASAVPEPGKRGVRFEVRKGGTDPYFFVTGSGLKAPEGYSRVGAVLVTVAFAAAAILVVLGLRSESPSGRPSFPAVQLALAAGLVVAMAVMAPKDNQTHPDEFSHIQAGRYYQDRWMPPAIGDPDTVHSYSAYGFSYLVELDVVYFFAGKFVAALEFTGMDEYARFRLFNLGLLALLIAMAMQGRVTALVALPAACTPQAWYIFGYFNADAFALVATLLLTARVASVFEGAAVDARAPRRFDLGTAIAIGVLVALALLSKRTFYPLVAFIAGYALWRSGLRNALAYTLAFVGLALLALWHFAAPIAPALPGLLDSADRMAVAATAFGLLGAAAWLLLRHPGSLGRLPRTLVVAAAVALVLVGTRLGVEFAINGLPHQKSAALTAFAEKVAKPKFRPSALGSAASYYGLALAARGVGFDEMMFGKYAGMRLLSTSSFGVYGYMSIYGPEWLYQAQYPIALLLLFVTGLACARDAEGRGVFLLGLGGAALVILIALLYSWTRDFQPQGRYLFAILPIFGALLLQAHRGEPPAGRGALVKVLFAATTLLWLMALYSFGYAAIPGVVRPA